MLNIPDTWVIFDAKKEGNEVWIFLRPKETPLSDNLRTEVLRHLEVFGSKAYLKLYYSTEEEIYIRKHKKRMHKPLIIIRLTCASSGRAKGARR